MINADIPSSIWPKIVLIIIKIINRTTTRIFAEITPYKTFMDQIYPEKKSQYKPKVSHLQILRYKTYV